LPLFSLDSAIFFGRLSGANVWAGSESANKRPNHGQTFQASVVFPFWGLRNEQAAGDNFRGLSLFLNPKLDPKEKSA